jgi:hypothetical protein
MVGMSVYTIAAAMEAWSEYSQAWDPTVYRVYIVLAASLVGFLGLGVVDGAGIIDQGVGQELVHRDRERRPALRLEITGKDGYGSYGIGDATENFLGCWLCTEERGLSRRGPPPFVASDPLSKLPDIADKTDGDGTRGEAMILRGSIERFDLGSVLQFLAQNAATGILEIRDYEEHGNVYLVKGRLEAISLPLTDDRLGVFLLKRGLLAENHLAKVLMEEAAGLEGNDARKPLGQRLVERGFVGESVIRQAMHRLTMARIFEITHWRTGVFSYDEPAQMPDFQIAIRADVQELLLKTQVRIDHGERPRKMLSAKQDDLCYGCTISDCSPAVKLKYLKRDMCLWRKMSSPPDVVAEPRNELFAEETNNEVALQGQWGQF